MPWADEDCLVNVVFPVHAAVILKQQWKFSHLATTEDQEIAILHEILTV